MNQSTASRQPKQAGAQPPRTSRARKAEEIRTTIIGHWRTHTDRQIADILRVSPTTVGAHRKRLEEAGEILPRIETGQSFEACLHEVSIFAIEPSPENDKLYDPIREDDPAFVSFVENVRTNGILVPPVVSADGIILSGHRRYAAACALGMERITVRIDPDISYSGDRDRFLRALVSYNDQRVKTTTEAIREGVVNMADDAWQLVRQYRREASAIDGADVLHLVGAKTRSVITQKLSFREAILRTVNENRKEWPLSDRRIFYLLLNVPGLLRNDLDKTPFENDTKGNCYNDTTNMVTRMRIDGSIPFDCITDETRPVCRWGNRSHPGE